MSGAKIAMKMNAPTNRKPICAPVFRRTRRHASRHRPLGWSKTSSADSSSATLIRASSRVPDPGVDHAVEQVDDEVHEHEDDREEEDAALEHGIVAVEDRLREPGTDSGPREDRLGEDRAGEQQARLETDHRGHRQ